MDIPTAAPISSEQSRFSIWLARSIWIVAAAAVLVAILVVTVAELGAIADRRHRVALAHLVSDGAIVGTPRYGSGVTIRLAGGGFTDGHLRYLQDVNGVRELAIEDAPGITDAGIATLGRRNDIEELALIRTRISPASLRQIGEWTALTRLDIPGMDLKGSDLIHLKNLTNLKLLFLDETPLTDADLREFDNLPNVLWLSLKDTQMTDARVAELRKARAGTRVVR